MANVLLAGQDFQFLDLLQAEIEGHGHTVLWASTGLEAYEIALAQGPDMVFLEAAIPVFSGFEACEMIRQDPEIPKELPILIISGGDIDTRRVEQVGADGVFYKVHTDDEVREVLAEFLAEKAGRA